MFISLPYWYCVWIDVQNALCENGEVTSSCIYLQAQKPGRVGNSQFNDLYINLRAVAFEIPPIIIDTSNQSILSLIMLTCFLLD